MPVTPDPVATTSWRWKPVDIVVLVIAFAVWWPLGLGVLGWKLWNDRQPVPVDLGARLQVMAGQLQAALDSLWAGLSQPAAGPAAPDAPTGNAAFDAHVPEERARLAADQRRLDEEIAAFRAYIASPQSGDREVYERFRSDRSAGRA
jgi:hypothetical protein